MKDYRSLEEFMTDWRVTARNLEGDLVLKESEAILAHPNELVRAYRSSSVTHLHHPQGHSMSKWPSSVKLAGEWVELGLVIDKLERLLAAENNRDEFN